MAENHKFYTEIIAGYTFRVFETPDGHIQYGAPMGNTDEEKQVFDDLVYMHNSLYNGKVEEKEVIKAKIAEFIRARLNSGKVMIPFLGTIDIDSYMNQLERS